jgi:hypothetical protein
MKSLFTVSGDRWKPRGTITGFSFHEDAESYYPSRSHSENLTTHGCYVEHRGADVSVRLIWEQK